MSTLCLPLTESPGLVWPTPRCVIGTHAASRGARLVLAGTTLHARAGRVTRGNIGQQALAAQRTAARCRPREATASATASAGTVGRWPARRRARAQCAQASPRHVRAHRDAAKPRPRCSPGPALPPQGAVCAGVLRAPPTSTPALLRTGPLPLPPRCCRAATANVCSPLTPESSQPPLANPALRPPWPGLRPSSNLTEPTPGIDTNFSFGFVFGGRLEERGTR